MNVGTSRAYTGDLVATRRNDRTPAHRPGPDGENRDHWTVEAVHDDGSLAVTGRTGRVTLPADYVAAHVELAYAETSHATQGRTVDRSFLFLDGPTGTCGIYVPLTRGRTSNEAFVVLHDERTAAEVVTEAVARTWIDQPATAVRVDRPARPSGDSGGAPAPRPTRTVLAAPVPLPERELRALVGRAAAHRAAATRLSWRLRDHDQALAHLAERNEELHGQIRHARGRLTEAARTLAEHDRPIHRRHHRAEVTGAKREAEPLPGWIDDLERELDQLPAAIEAERAAREQAVRLGRAMRRGEPERVEQALDEDARARGMAAADQPSPVLVAHLGPVPHDPTARERWIEAAGRIAQHRALWRVPIDVPLGPAPLDGPPEQSLTYYAATKAVAALDRAIGIERREVNRPELGGLSL